MVGATKAMVDFCTGLSYRELTPGVIDRVKYLALDFLGVVARGSRAESSQAVRSFIRDVGVASNGGVIIGTHSISPEIPVEHFVAYHEICETYGDFSR